jgi:hypothetical protein
MNTKQQGGICPVCILPLAVGAVGVGSVGYGLSKTKSKTKSKSKSKSKLTKSKKGGKKIKGGTSPKKSKRKSMKGRLIRHRKSTPPPPPSPPRSIYEWLFGRGPKPPTPSPPNKNSKDINKDPNYEKLSKVIAREMKIPTAHGEFVYKQNSKEKQRHHTKTKNLYNALYQ